MAVTRFVNLAVKVADLPSAIACYERLGARVIGPTNWRGSQKAEVFLGPLQITLFTRAVYEPPLELPEEGFLHAVLQSDDLDGDLAGSPVVFGPTVVEGDFGVRRIAFVAAPGGIRLEFMEQLKEPE